MAGLLAERFQDVADIRKSLEYTGWREVMVLGPGIAILNSCACMTRNSIT
jgi:hypothetical protein